MLQQLSDLVLGGNYVEFDDSIDYPLRASLVYTRLVFAAYSDPDSLVHSPLFEWPAWMGASLKEGLAGGLGGVDEPFELVEWVNVADTSTQAFVAQNTSTLVLCVRGTDDLTDWEVNLETLSVAFEPFAAGAPSYTCGFDSAAGAVHAGFYAASKNLWALIDAHLLPALTAAGGAAAPPEVVICGHSKGGANAALAYAYLLAKLSALPAAALAPAKRLTLFTLGQPRVGNAAFAAALEARAAAVRAAGLPLRAWRLVNDNDVVPMVPPTWLGFRHFGACATYDARVDGTHMLCFRPDAHKDTVMQGAVANGAPVGAAAPTVHLVPAGLDVASYLLNHMPPSYDACAVECIAKYLDGGNRKGRTLLQVLAARG